MKNKKNILLPALAFLVILPGFVSCKKGDGDPFLSIYSRKDRLCNEWKVNKIEQTVTYKTTTVTTTLEGEKMTVEMVVRDTTIVLPDTTLYEYRHKSTFTGSAYYSFEKSGSYQIDEAFTDDTTGVQYASQEKGLWYFTGGNRDSDTKSKELLGLQSNNYVFNPLSPNTYTWTYAGENAMRVYHIYELAKKQVELRFSTTETTNLFTVTTESKIILKPK